MSFKSKRRAAGGAAPLRDLLWDVSDSVFMPSGELEELEGALHALLELHYSVDILAEHQLAPRLQEFPLVVIPNSHKLSAEFKEAAIRYVENGGSLLLLGEKSARLFEPQLGARLAGEPKESAAELATPLGPVSLTGSWQAVSPETAKAVGTRYPTRDFRRDGETAATFATCGRGRLAAVYGPIATSFMRGHHPGVRLFLGEIVRRLFDAPSVTTDAPPTVDIALRRAADGRLTVHFLNRSGFPVPDMYNFIDFVPPVGPFEVSLKAETRPKSVAWMPEGQPVKWAWKNGWLRATVPSLAVHGILVVE